jgi:DNA-binding transcriptional ArsR family regulator
MLALSGLPTLFPKLVEARTFSERMFHIIFLDRLSDPDSRDAILKPINDTKCPVKFSPESVNTIVKVSGGYPYFIQFICREVYDVFIQKVNAGEKPSVPVEEINRKLDSDFFAGRWARATDRQRELLGVIARLDSADEEFTVQEIVERSKLELPKPFSSSHVNQMLVSLTEAGLVYKNRHGKYSFAVPLLGQFILRQLHQVGGQQKLI